MGGTELLCSMRERPEDPGRDELPQLTHHVTGRSTFNFHAAFDSPFVESELIRHDIRRSAVPGLKENSHV
jgi:hypothetical protein